MALVGQGVVALPWADDMVALPGVVARLVFGVDPAVVQDVGRLDNSLVAEMIARSLYSRISSVPEDKRSTYLLLLFW